MPAYNFPNENDQKRFEEHKASRESLSPMGELALIRTEIQRLLREKPGDPALIKAAEAVAKLAITAQKELTKAGELYTREEVGYLLQMFTGKAADAMKPLCLALVEAYPDDPVIADLHDSLCSSIAGELGNERCREIAQQEVLKLRERAEQSKKRKPRLAHEQ